MKCPTCGAENDAANRFCEQCGSPLGAGGAAQQVQVDLASAPTAAGPTCPNCGAAVLPGEAFCDECGAALNPTVPTPAPTTAAADAPTMIAPPTPPAATTSANGQSVVCPSCGHQNLPGDRFCDNCGAALPAEGAPSSPAVATTDQTLIQSPPSAAAEAPAMPAEAPAATEQPASTPPPAEAPTVEYPVVPTPEGDAQASYEAERKRLEEEIARQQQIITQFEQMQQMFGAAAPAAVTQGLSEARDARARAEADLAALQPPAPPVDPAEVQRLEEEIARQQQIITQFEQMQQMFGAAAPAAVTQGLSEARDARARAEADLAALRGGAAPSGTAAAPTGAAPSQAQAQEAQAESQLGALGTVPAPSAVVPAEAPATPAPPETAISEPAREAVPPPAVQPAPASQPAAPAAPRLVMDDGRELALPADKREIIVGREDPISGIFPEIDLTPFGGETGGVSRQHARLTRTDGQWSVTDLNSTNYTRVDGARIEPSVAVPIKNGSRLQFGRVAMTFQE